MIHRLHFQLVLLALLCTSFADDAPKHWAFEPIREMAPPRVATNSWCRTPVDRFILSKLTAQGLAPAQPADARTLVRRIYFDLAGLPPTPVEVDDFLRAFVRNPSSAVSALTEKLLASPEYGERWGRWWLDVARYADTNGQDENKVMANAWRYRDWVIASFNRNQPFNEFITEQLAGDLIPAHGSELETIERRIATGFLVLGPKMLAEQDKPKMVMDIVDEQIDTVGRAFLGLTLGCARCHDHKFDPIPTRDYYAMAGIFKSTRTMADLAFVSRFNETSIATTDEVVNLKLHQQRLAGQTNQINALVKKSNEAVLTRWKKEFPKYLAAASDAGTNFHATLNTNLVHRFRELLAANPKTNIVSRALHHLQSAPDSDYLARLESATEKNEIWEALLGKKGVFALPKEPKPFYPTEAREALASLERERDALLARLPATPEALTVAEDKAGDVPVHIRGKHLNLAKDPVPRGFIQAAFRNPPRIPADHSGRLELTQWLTDPENPLTARVVVNRIWQAHFGEGLVRTPDNFGLRGAIPSHPELLDWLAGRFIRSGWDVKAIHRLIIHSSVFQQSSRANPQNRNSTSIDPENRLLARFPRQRLEAEMLRDSVLAVSGRLERTMGGTLVAWKNNEYAPGDEISAKTSRRTVYLPIVRDRVFDALTIFDFANPSVCTAQRVPTVVSHQALFFLNSPLIKHSAAALAKDLELEVSATSDRVREAYNRILNRPATDSDLLRALAFLNEWPEEARASQSGLAALCQTLLASNEFMYRF